MHPQGFVRRSPKWAGAPWKERIQGASFLAARSRDRDGADQPAPSAAAKRTEEEFEAEWAYEVPLAQAAEDTKLNIPGIYTLFKKGRRFYVGQSENLQTRLRN
jgi:hypothetical protein